MGEASRTDHIEVLIAQLLATEPDQTADLLVRHKALVDIELVERLKGLAERQDA